MQAFLLMISYNSPADAYYYEIKKKINCFIEMGRMPVGDLDCLITTTTIIIIVMQFKMITENCFILSISLY